MSHKSKKKRKKKNVPPKNYHGLKIIKTLDKKPLGAFRTRVPNGSWGPWWTSKIIRELYLLQDGTTRWARLTCERCSFRVDSDGTCGHQKASKGTKWVPIGWPCCGFFEDKKEVKNDY